MLIFMPGGNCGSISLASFCLDAFGDGHGVGVGDLDHAEADRHLAVEARQLAVVGEAVLELGDVAEAHRDAVALRHDQAAERIEGMEFEVELDQVFGGLADHEAAGQLHVLAAKALAMSCAEIASAVMRSGSRLTRMVRSRRPPRRTSPTPSMVSSAS
jgi:hypothetical protein